MSERAPAIINDSVRDDATRRGASPSIERVFPGLARLNEEQQAAAAFEGDQLRILAGAGTGKTTALTARIACLVERGIRPERIMALTFTRRAAREMVHRTRDDGAPLEDSARPDC